QASLEVFERKAEIILNLIRIHVLRWVPHIPFRRTAGITLSLGFLVEAPASQAAEKWGRRKADRTGAGRRGPQQAPLLRFAGVLSGGAAASVAAASLPNCPQHSSARSSPFGDLTTHRLPPPVLFAFFLSLFSSGARLLSLVIGAKSGLRFSAGFCRASNQF